jgi:protein-S-isoprenylcysteine O-methyltransferase Ste14
MFKASALEFRLRYWLHAVVFGLGFWAPWNLWLHADPTGANAHTWGILAANMNAAGWMGFDASFNALLVTAIVLALLAAGLRTWGGAYLGSDVVQDGAMHTADSPVPFAGPAVRGVLTDGPYRHLRNPLYLGTFLHTLALALLMPRSGAVFAIVVIGVMQVRLILGEEAFLLRTVGLPYEAYCKLVPRLWPALRGKVAAGGRRARWGQALLGESYFWLVAFSFCFAGWRYNAVLLIQWVLVAFGISLMVRAAAPRPRPA